MSTRNQKIGELIIVLDAMNATGAMRYEDYSFFHDAINDLRDEDS